MVPGGFKSLTHSFRSYPASIIIFYPNFSLSYCKWYPLPKQVFIMQVFRKQHEVEPYVKYFLIYHNVFECIMLITKWWTYGGMIKLNIFHMVLNLMLLQNACDYINVRVFGNNKTWAKSFFQISLSLIDREGFIGESNSSRFVVEVQWKDGLVTQVKSVITATKWSSVSVVCTMLLMLEKVQFVSQFKPSWLSENN